MSIIPLPAARLPGAVAEGGPPFYCSRSPVSRPAQGNPGQALVDVVRVVSGVPAENRTAASYLLPAPIAFQARPPSGKRIQPLIEQRT
jgi:hypothetical protein